MGLLSGKNLCVRVFGCQMNVYDGEVITSLLEREGCIECSDPEEADIVIFVTCSVRAHAENRVFSLIGEIKKIKDRRSGIPVLGIMGCTAQKMGEEYIRRFPQIDFVIGTHAIDRVADILTQVMDGNRPVVEVEMRKKYVLEGKPAFRGHYSTYIPVARGCSHFCTYCIVPHLRGVMSSRPVESVIRQAEEFAAAGGIEVTFLGQNIDAYGKDTGYKPGLAGLLEQAAGIPGLRRIGFVTSHPADFSDDILRVMADNPVISPFFHIPPQSGSDSVLKAMKRGYTASEYLSLIDRIRGAVPEAEIAGDFIVGFPGETEDDFNQSLDLVTRIRFQQLYVFKYSPREGTYAASHLEDTVSVEDKKRRNNAMLKVQEQIQSEKHEEMKNRTLEVMVEGPSKKDGNRLFGRTPAHYRVVFDPSDSEQAGDIVSVRIETVTPLTLFGKRVS